MVVCGDPLEASQGSLPRLDPALVTLSKSSHSITSRTRVRQLLKSTRDSFRHCRLLGSFSVSVWSSDLSEQRMLLITLELV